MHASSAIIPKLTSTVVAVTVVLYIHPLFGEWSIQMNFQKNLEKIKRKVETKGKIILFLFGQPIGAYMGHDLVWVKIFGVFIKCNFFPSNHNQPSIQWNLIYFEISGVESVIHAYTDLDVNLYLPQPFQFVKIGLHIKRFQWGYLNSTTFQYYRTI